jgi:hypothetical protein
MRSGRMIRLVNDSNIHILLFNLINTGEVYVPLSKLDLASDDLEFWRDIKEPPKNVLGDICLSLRYAPQKRPPQLNVIVIECKNLKQMDLGGASDPYVKINHMVNGKRMKKYKTSVKMCDLNPYYNQSFKIEVCWGHKGGVSLVSVVS